MILSSAAMCAANPNGTRNGYGTSVADANVPFSNALFRCRICRPTPKAYCRRTARLSVRHHVGKGYAGPKAGPQCLQYCLFGSKPSGQVLEPSGSGPYLVQLRLNKTARKQGVEWIIDPPFHFGDVHDIYPLSNNGHVTLLFLFLDR